jgi:hypothetical protein
VNRLGAHLRDYPGHFTHVFFLMNHTDDRCARADREAATVDQLLGAGVRIRNKRYPDRPHGC